MDFHTLMNIASAKQENKDKIKISRYNLDLPPAKREVKDVARSDVVQRLIQEKENEKNVKEKALREREKTQERERKKKEQFRIPKKKEPEPKVVDTEKLINSLFEDTEEDAELVNGQNTSRLSPVDLEEKSKPVSLNHASKSSHSKSNDKNSSTLSSSSSSSSKDKSSSSRDTEKSSREKHKSSHESSKSSQSLSEDKKSHSSSHHSSSKSSSSKEGTKSSSSSKEGTKSSLSKEGTKSSSSSKEGTKSSSSSKEGTKSSSSKEGTKSSSSKEATKSSSSSKEGTKSSSSSSKSLSSSSKTQSSGSKSQSSTSSSSSNQKSSSSPKSESTSSSSQQPKPSSEQPITLAKHHLKPVAERHVDSTQLTEKERILAKLKAIKERTLAAINKEQEGKRKRSRGGEKTSRRSKEGEKEDERVKSKEIVRDVYSSEEETENNDIPSVLDIMLSEHKTKLEKEKISRQAKQAWARATKTDTGDSTLPLKKKKLHKRSHSVKSMNRHRKRKEHSLSPDARDVDRKKSKPNEEVRKKAKIVRHAGNAGPAPPNFQAILAMAAQKTKQPPKPLPTIPKKKKKEEEARPLTQEEKDRIKRRKSKEYQHWLKHGGKYPNGGNVSPSDEDEKESAKVKDKIVPSKQHRKEMGHSVASDSMKNNMSISAKGDKKKPYPLAGSKSKEITVNENVLVCGPAEDEDSDEGRNSRPANPFDKIFKSVHKKKSAQHAPAKRQLEDQDSESEESDLDGFIEDGNEEDEDYSKHISKIFGYNKQRYADEDDDLSDMEANFATVMMEEKRSAKLGLMEDLEDMRMEEEENKRKAMMKKKMRR